MARSHGSTSPWLAALSYGSYSFMWLIERSGALVVRVAARNHRRHQPGMHVFKIRCLLLFVQNSHHDPCHLFLLSYQISRFTADELFCLSKGVVLLFVPPETSATTSQVCACLRLDVCCFSRKFTSWPVSSFPFVPSFSFYRWWIVLLVGRSGVLAARVAVTNPRRHWPGIVCPHWCNIIHALMCSFWANSRHDSCFLFLSSHQVSLCLTLKYAIAWATVTAVGTIRKALVEGAFINVQ